MRAGLLLLVSCAALRAVPSKRVPDADAEKKQALLDYEFGENEKAQDPEQQAADQEATKTAQLEAKLKAQRSWEAPEEQKEDSVIHTVIEKEKSTDVEQEEIKRDLSRDKKLEEKVQSEHKWM